MDLCSVAPAVARFAALGGRCVVVAGAGELVCTFPVFARSASTCRGRPRQRASCLGQHLGDVGYFSCSSTGTCTYPPDAQSVAPGATSITVMSFNIWGLEPIPGNGSRRAGSRSGRYRRTPGALAPTWSGLLVVELGSEYPYHALEIGGRDYGLGAFSRYPLVRVEANHPWDPLSPVQVLRVARGGDVFFLYNVHLQASNVLVQVDTGGSLAEYTMLAYAHARGSCDAWWRISPRARSRCWWPGISTPRTGAMVTELLARELTDRASGGRVGLGDTPSLPMAEPGSGCPFSGE